MKPFVKNMLAVVAGIVMGSIVNMGIIMASGSIIPPPEGADVTTMEGLKASMHLFGPINFLFPFLAHAIGTFAGAWLAASVAATRKMAFAMVIGFVFLIGGISNILMLPSPLWFSVVDLAGAYLPMGYLGGKMAMKRL
jgi:hypothetical protein